MDSGKITTAGGGRRYGILDTVRGVTLLSMMLYHAAWDLVYIYGIKWDWYKGVGAYIWQQSICWSFILLSGFCWSMGKYPLKRGLTVFGGGALVSAVTCVFMPENRVLFGVLTLTGSCMLLMIPLKRPLKRIPPKAGLVISALLFALTRNVNEGYLGFEAFRIAKLPEGLYRGMLSAYLGFPPRTIFSTDYFSLMPWFFLFVSGYCLYGILYRRDRLEASVFFAELKPFGFLGRHSLIIYLLHQPVLYALCGLVFGF